MAESPSTRHLYSFNNCRCRPCKAAMRLYSSTVQLELHSQQTFRWLEWICRPTELFPSNDITRSPPQMELFCDHVVGLQSQHQPKKINTLRRLSDQGPRRNSARPTPYTHSMYSTLSVMCGYEHTAPVLLQ
ncbi:Dihydrolipoyllysine-residue succinyltransferase component of 2-oxoglutarate dehydrogenase complex [Fusarium oxysporum f. sp. albedinis]|nr:Dihydrolipoyllysine-residue succinyltransferase component of 2-oxoglutarate dehydrogenase complex [Fusarium oxysporum f. sp. albedinis]